MSKFDTFPDFVASDVWIKDEGPDRMFRPQAFWLAEQNNNKLLVDRVLHVESLNGDLRRLLLDIGVPRTKLPEALPHLNATRKLEVAYALPPELMAKVKERYHRDLDVFGYQIPAATAETVRGVASA